MEPQTDYGLFTNLVSTVGTVVAASTAIGLTWRRRARWEPSEQDVDAGAQKVAGLLCAIGLAIMRGTMFSVEHRGDFISIAVYGGLAALIALLLYGIVIASFTYDRVQGAHRTDKVIGGFWLTSRIRRILAQDTGPRTVQEAFASAAYDFDLIWPKPSRALSKAAFTLSYIVLIVSGTMALAAGGFILDLPQA